MSNTNSISITIEPFALFEHLIHHDLLLSPPTASVFIHASSPSPSISISSLTPFISTTFQINPYPQFTTPIILLDLYFSTYSISTISIATSSCSIIIFLLTFVTKINHHPS